MAHVIVMGLIRKPHVTKYWSQNPNISTPFFRKYMGRMNFECILSNIHLSDGTLASTDPLVKLKPFIDMCDRNFLHVYKVTRISVWMRQVVSGKASVATKSTTQESHQNLYQVCEADSGYVIAFEVYFGKANSACIEMSKPINTMVNNITKLVLGMLEKGQLLDKGYNVFTDNFYTSPELLFECFYRQTFGTGTVQGNRKNMPKGVIGAK